MMVNAGLTTFKKIEETNPREIELVGLYYYSTAAQFPLSTVIWFQFLMFRIFTFQIVNRHPPFGSQVGLFSSSFLQEINKLLTIYIWNTHEYDSLFIAVNDFVLDS